MKTRPAEPMKTRPSVDFLVEFWALRDPSNLVEENFLKFVWFQNREVDPTFEAIIYEKLRR
jgi:hypothetical protein